MNFLICLNRIKKKTVLKCTCLTGSVCYLPWAVGLWSLGLEWFQLKVPSWNIITICHQNCMICVAIMLSVYNHPCINHWKQNIVNLLTSPSLMALQVVIMTTYGGIPDDKVVKLMIFSFHWFHPNSLQAEFCWGDTIIFVFSIINPFWPNDAIWQHRSGCIFLNETMNMDFNFTEVCS